MKNRLLISLFFVVLGNFCFAEQMDQNRVVQENPKNFVDEIGRKQGKWVHLGKEQPDKGYPEDGKISEGTYLDDRRDGKWILYYNDGITPKTLGEYKNNRPNGPFIQYHPNGVIREIGTFSKQRYSDSLSRFNEKGVKVYEAYYNEAGKESGKVIHRYDNGKIEFEYEANNGVPTGKAVRYWPNGDVKEKIVYGADGSVQETSGEIAMVNTAEQGVQISNAKKAPKPEASDSFKPNDYNKVLNDDKEIWMEGEFKNGLLWDGKLYIYDEDGLLLKLEIYKEGVYISDGQL
jgi:antitoxin component YwqK of YwqJK toxin-antitoxin module